ncbi:MAG TPA: hypothetical protein VJS64_05005, partial [Pyrinomonadaceae bacterium]|nr:hypothetical protein [Pyrinomonadaceae bacterium]
MRAFNSILLKQADSVVRTASSGILVCVIAGILSGIGPRVVTFAQASGNQPPPEQVSPDPWPKTAQLNGAKFTLYQPQLESWDGYNLVGHAAVSVLPAGAKSPVFGAINISAVTIVDREARIVHFQNIEVQKTNFPSVPAKAAQYQATIKSIIAKGPATMALDKLQAALAVLRAQQKGSA